MPHAETGEEISLVSLRAPVEEACDPEELDADRRPEQNSVTVETTLLGRGGRDGEATTTSASGLRQPAFTTACRSRDRHRSAHISFDRRCTPSPYRCSLCISPRFRPCPRIRRTRRTAGLRDGSACPSHCSSDTSPCLVLSLVPGRSRLTPARHPTRALPRNDGQGSDEGDSPTSASRVAQRSAPGKVARSRCVASRRSIARERRQCPQAAGGEERAWEAEVFEQGHEPVGPRPSIGRAPAAGQARSAAALILDRKVSSTPLKALSVIYNRTHPVSLGSPAPGRGQRSKAH